MKNMILLLGLLLCLCVSSWGACVPGDFYGVGSIEFCSSTGSVGIDPNPTIIKGECSSTKYYYSGSAQRYVYFTGYRGANCSYTPSGYTGGCTNNYCSTGSCAYSMRCDTQAEADSVVIAQKCTSGTMAKDTANGTIFDVCKNGEGLLISFNNPITGVRNSSIGYYIVTDDSADLLDEATYNHLAALSCTEVSLYRGVLNGKYVYWYSTDPEPAGVVNVVRIK